jgi:DNA-directed RNA polymerase subunit RPC12/RpoP
MTSEDIYMHLLGVSELEVDAESLQYRVIRCPHCNFKVQTVYNDCRQGHIMAKCHKCKRDLIFNLQYFRTQKRYSC